MSWPSAHEPLADTWSPTRRLPAMHGDPSHTALRTASRYCNNWPDDDIDALYRSPTLTATAGIDTQAYKGFHGQEWAGKPDHSFTGIGY